MRINQTFSFFKTQSSFPVHFLRSIPLAYNPPLTSQFFQSTFEKWTESGLKVDCTQTLIHKGFSNIQSKSPLFLRKI